MIDFFFQPHLIALGVLVCLYAFLYGFWSGKWNPIGLFVGADKRPSTSKFQLTIWTLVGLYSYLVIFAARAWHGFYDAVDQVPPNLLTAMGFSVFTAAAAKGITAGYVQSGRSARADAPETRPDPADPTNKKTSAAGTPISDRGSITSLVTDDNGHADLSKIQMICWTLISVGIYLVGLFAAVNKIPDVMKDPAVQNEPNKRFTPAFVKAHPDVVEKLSLPDISATLMVLMGIGHGAYLGKKLVTFDTARLTQVNPSAAKPGTEVTITGVSLSEAADGNQVTINGQPIDGLYKADKSQIKFKFPDHKLDNTPWEPGDRVQIGTITSGQESANTQPFTVTLPELLRLDPETGKAGAGVSLVGKLFGAEQGKSQVLINGQAYTTAIDKKDWTDTTVKIMIPAGHKAGAYDIVVAIDGLPPTKAKSFTVT